MEPKYWDYKVAALNIHSFLKQKDYNTEYILKMTREAAENGAKLIVMPEMATTGYCWYSRKEISLYAETVPGPTTNAFWELAKEFDCYIAVGMVEVDPKTDAYYNTAALVGPEGVIGIHRKSHVFLSEPKWSKQGNVAHEVFETPIGNISMLVCMDIHYFETSRLEGLRGADVILHLSAWFKEKTPAQYWLTRAFDNGAYLVESNRLGLERSTMFSGGSCVVNPDGTLQTFMDEQEGICYGEVHLKEARKKTLPDGLHKFRDRRPKEYIGIMQNTYLWNPLEFFRLYEQDCLPAGSKFKATVVQMRPELGNMAKNMRKIEEKVTEATTNGSKLIVFPELALTGLVPPDKAKRLAQSTEGEFIDFLLDLSKKYHVFIVAGMPEKDGDHYYNTAILSGPDDLAGKYRKIHLSPYDNSWAAPGDLGFMHFNTPLGRIGLMIGTDAIFPESARMLALQAVDMICCPSAVSYPEPFGLSATAVDHGLYIPRGYDTVHMHLWRVRGGENDSIMLFANQIGEGPEGHHFFGRSGIFDACLQAVPRNEVLLSREKEEIASLELDTSDLPGCPYPVTYVRFKEHLRMRQPLWYDLIAQEEPPVLKILK